MPSHRQASFAAGEVTPDLYGRTDLPNYAHALRTCKNFLPIQSGALVNRPGTVLVAGVKDYTKKVRLVPFIFSDAQTFVLEFGDTYVRFYQNGGQVLSGGVPYEIASPFTQAMLPYLKFAQSGDFITICYGGQAQGVAALAPQDLKRITNTNWTIAATLFAPSAPITQSRAFIGRAGWSAAVTYGIGDRVYYTAAGISDTWISKRDGNLNQAPAAGSAYWIPCSDDNHAPRRWSIYVTTVVRDTGTGAVQETLPSTGRVFTDSVYSDRPLKLFSPTVPTSLSGIQALQYNFYASGGGLIGFIGAADAASGDVAVPLGAWSIAATYVSDDYVSYGGFTYQSLQAGNVGNQPDISPTWWLKQPVVSFIWDGSRPDYSAPPPAGTDPFKITDQSTGVSTHYYPSCVGYFEQRRMFARSSKFPNNFWGSAVGNYIDFDQPLLAGDDVAIQFAIASQVLEEIRSILSIGRSLLLTTGDGVYGARGVQGGALTRTNVDVKRQTRRGSSWLTPLTIGNTILFNTAKGSAVRDLTYDWQTDSYTGIEVSHVANHLFGGHGLVDWAFAEQPYPVAYMVRDDGLLLTLTYSRELQMAAWAQHVTGLDGADSAPQLFDYIENVCVVPEGNEDAVYLVVARWNGYTPGPSAAPSSRFVERMASRTIPRITYTPPSTGIFTPPFPRVRNDVRFCNFLDCSSVFDGRNKSAVTILLSNANGDVSIPGTQCDCTLSATGAGGPLSAGFSAGDVGKNAVVLDPDAPSPITLKIVGRTSATVARVEITAAGIVGYGVFSVATTAWGYAKISFTLNQFAARNIESGDPAGTRGVAVLADGLSLGQIFDGQSTSQTPNFDDIGLTLTLADPAVVVIAGLSYNSDAEVHDLPFDQLRSNVIGVTRAVWEVVYSRGLWTGEDFAHLTEADPRDVSDDYGIPSLRTEQIPVTTLSSWNIGGRVVIRQIDPLPLTIVGLTRELEVGGKG